MPKLTTKQRRMLKEEILSGKFTKEELSTQYGLTRRQINNYWTELGVNKKGGAQLKEHDILSVEQEETQELEVKNMEEDNLSDEDEIIVQEKVEVPEVIEQDDLKAEDLIKKKTEESEPVDIDPKKDYCGKCYKNNLVTEITRDMESCPICGAVLNWL